MNPEPIDFEAVHLDSAKVLATSLKYTKNEIKKIKEELQDSFTEINGVIGEVGPIGPIGQIKVYLAQEDF